MRRRIRLVKLLLSVTVTPDAGQAVGPLRAKNLSPPIFGGLKSCARRESPAVVSLTGNAFGPGLAVFAFRAHLCGSHLKQKQRSGLRLPHAHPAGGVLGQANKNRPNGRFLVCARREANPHFQLRRLTLYPLNYERVKLLFISRGRQNQIHFRSFRRTF